jgi:hypothetical protein
VTGARDENPHLDASGARSSALKALPILRQQPTFLPLKWVKPGSDDMSAQLRGSFKLSPRTDVAEAGIQRSRVGTVGRVVPLRGPPIDPRVPVAQLLSASPRSTQAIRASRLSDEKIASRRGPPESISLTPFVFGDNHALPPE